MSDEFASKSVEEIFNEVGNAGVGIPATEEQGPRTPPPPDIDGLAAACQRELRRMPTEMPGLDPARFEKLEKLRSALDRLATVETIMGNLLKSVWNSNSGPDIAILKIWANTLEACLPLASQAVYELKAIVTKEEA